jgi:hypothetical protein
MDDQGVNRAGRGVITEDEFIGLCVRRFRYKVISGLLMCGGIDAIAILSLFGMWRYIWLALVIMGISFWIAHRVQLLNKCINAQSKLAQAEKNNSNTV